MQFHTMIWVAALPAGKGKNMPARDQRLDSGKRALAFESISHRSSVSATSTLSLTSSKLARSCMVRMVALFAPRSISPIYRKLYPEAMARSIWDQPLFLRKARTALPNACSKVDRLCPLLLTPAIFAKSIRSKRHSSAFSKNAYWIFPRVELSRNCFARMMIVSRGTP